MNYYLEHYFEPDKYVSKMSVKEKRAIIEEIHADIFAYQYWDSILEEYELTEIEYGIDEDDNLDEIAPPNRGGWSSEDESDEHKALKEYVAKHPSVVGLSKRNKKGITEYLFASGDKADVVFEHNNGLLGVEVKSIISNDSDINRGIFQAVKYQALLRAEQKASLIPPTARSVLVVENPISAPLQNLADVLGIEVHVVNVNNA